MFRRPIYKSEIDNRVFVDSKLKDSDNVKSFGFEWTEIDGYVGKETLSYGHIFGRFLLEENFFQNKIIADIGCGNGRLGRIIAPYTSKYFGIELSESIFSFPKNIECKSLNLIQATGTDLPLRDNATDITLCWGVMHHMDKPFKGLNELIRVTKSGGTILICIYPHTFNPRQNFNNFVKNIEENSKFDLIEKTSDYLDTWREVDSFYADLLSKNIFLSVKKSREWQIFQWFDGITPQYHWSLETKLDEVLIEKQFQYIKTRPGCYKITNINKNSTRSSIG